MEITNEVVTEKLAECQRAINRRRHQFTEPLVLQALFDVVDIAAGDRFIKDVDDLGQQRSELFVRKRSLTVARGQRHQRLGGCCFAI